MDKELQKEGLTEVATLKQGKKASGVATSNRYPITAKDSGFHGACAMVTVSSIFVHASFPYSDHHKHSAFFLK